MSCSPSSGVQGHALHGISDQRIDGEFRQVLCNLKMITQATHPQNQAGNKHVSFASRQHKATLQCQTQDAMTSLKFTVVPHPPYSPLALSDFWLFPKLKETLKKVNIFIRVPKLRQLCAKGSATKQKLSSCMEWTNKRTEWFKKFVDINGDCAGPSGRAV